MALKNTDNSYGSLTKWFHWISALAIIGLFILGLWMVTLTYYDSWYKTAPDIHRGVGVLLAVFILARLAWRMINVQPHDPNHTAFEKFAAAWTHRLLYVFLFALFISGYLISTTDGRAIEVFGLFGLPSVYQNPELATPAGLVHEYVAYAMIAFAVLHAAGAFKHHIIDKDRTLIRMLPEFGRKDTGLSAGAQPND